MLLAHPGPGLSNLISLDSQKLGCHPCLQHKKNSLDKKGNIRNVVSACPREAIKDPVSLCFPPLRDGILEFVDLRAEFHSDRKSQTV
jgi:hypothetical protein